MFSAYLIQPAFMLFSESLAAGGLSFGMCLFRLLSTPIKPLKVELELDEHTACRHITSQIHFLSAWICRAF